MSDFILAEGCHVHIHTMDKFKTDTAAVSFVWPLNPKISSAVYLLSYILADSCEAFPTKKSVIQQLDSLYGASINIVNDPFGNVDRLRFSISGIDSVNGEHSQLEGLLDMLSQFIFHPRLLNGVFADTVFHECLEQAVIGIQEYLDDPFFLCSENAYSSYGGPISRRVMPKAEEVMKLTPQECTDCWKQIVASSRIDIQILSNQREETILPLVKRWFPFAPRNGQVKVHEPFHGQKGIIEVSRDIAQSHIVMLFETGIYSGMESLCALSIGNGIFGSLPISMLFQKVREEKGLCYTIDSRVLSHDGILRVYAAGRDGALDEIRTCVEEQLQLMKQGKFSDEQLEASRLMAINGMRSARDIPDALLSSWYRKALIQEIPEFKDHIDRCKRVTREDVMKVFEPIELKTVSIVRQEEVQDAE